MEAVRRDGSSKAAWIELSNMFYKSRGDKCQSLNEKRKGIDIKKILSYLSQAWIERFACTRYSKMLTINGLCANLTGGYIWRNDGKKLVIKPVVD